jgi:amidase
MKPTHGLVSGDYVIPLVDWMDVPGPMGRTVTDVATLLGALTHTDEGSEENPDPAVARLQSEDFTRFLDVEQAKQRRVGVVVIPEAAIAEIEAALANPPADMTPDIQAVLPILLGQYKRASQSANAAIAALTQQGITVVELDAATVPQAPDANAVLPPGFKASLNAFLPTLPNPPVAALIDVVSFNYADPSNRIPYGQRHLEAAQRSDSPSAAYTTLRETHQTTARTDLDQFFAEAGIDVLIAGTQAYAAAGYPALTIPIGFAETGEPLGVALIGRALSEPDLLAVGYAIEQATQARKAPDLERTLATFANLHHAVPSAQ